MIAKALLCGLRYDEWLLGGFFCISKWLPMCSLWLIGCC